LWDAISPLLVSGGLVGAGVAIARLVYRLHYDAVGAEKRRADDWRLAYERELARGDVRETQLAEIMKVIRERS
jgi:hypothetical protein